MTTRRGVVWLLGLGAFGLAFSITTTAAYLPPLLEQFTDSNTMIAAVLAAEGVFALTLPLVIGPWSDTFKTPMGRRRPFMLAALGPMGFCLAIVAFMPNIWTITLIVLAFFFAYYVYEPPYRGLYPDILHESLYGRSQGVQHVLRGIALGVALVAGGFLFKVWHPAPFLLAAVATTAACGAVILYVREPEGEGSRVFRGVRSYVKTSWTVFFEVPEVRRFLFANAAWEGTFAAMRTFVVLYITIGLGQPLSTSSAVLATVAVGYVIAALGSWKIGDRLGLARVILGASIVYGAGLLVAGLAQEWHNWYYGLILPVAVAGGTVMTLSWALLFKLMPAQHRGAIAGLATTTKGLGLLIGPLVAGIMIDVTKPYLSSTDGYAVLWPVCAVPVLAAIPLVASLIPHESASGSAEPQPS
ncbi:MAG TPA: MFS transporter [Gaiellaceae bacterium]|nr:MFS transporter [Gaiellaceae bacterium]